jgi:hypothetical protein
MQATDFADGDDFAHLRRLDGPAVRCILGEGEMGPGVMVVLEIRGQDISQVALAQDDDVVETLAPNRADQAFGERILPWAVRRREDFVDPHALHAVPKVLAVDLVTVAQEVGWRGIVRERVHDLLGGPGGGGMFSVTLKWTTRRRWWASTTRTKRTRR